MFAIVLAATLALPIPQSGGRLVDAGGGSIDYGPGQGLDCISPEQRAEVERRIEVWQALQLLVPNTLAFTSLSYTFYPMGGRLDRDIFINNYNDLDPTAGILDWDCGNRTYDGHDATDTGLRSFGEQLIGVPIYSALDGMVIAAHDGEPDMHTSCSGIANYVTIDHGRNRVAGYWHMKNGSVAGTVGQSVVAGEQIGQVASSGCSTGPHLHFASFDNGSKVEPFTGPCNPGTSGWSNQTPIEYDLVMSEWAISQTSPSGIVPPNVMPRDSHWAQTNSNVYFWCYLRGLPASSTWIVRFKRPDGTIAFNSGSQAFNAGNPYFRWSYWTWNYIIPEMQTLAGTWEVRLKVNGVVLIDAPLEVFPTAMPGFNRAPEPISLAFVPASATPDDVLRCEIDTDLVMDDLDWDIVSYDYVWKVNGGIVRSVTSAAHMDALPRNSWAHGDVVTCEVTPSDGTASGPTALATLGAAKGYCTAGTSASGCQALLSASGTASATAATGFSLIASVIEGQKDGLYFFGANGRQANPWGSGTSYQCVVPPVKRAGLLVGTGTSGLCDGSFSQDLNARWTAKPAQNPGAGAVVQAQLWYRDPFNTSNQTTSLSDAIEFSVGP